MSTTIKTPHRSLVALSLPKRVPALIVYAEGIVSRMTGRGRDCRRRVGGSPRVVRPVTRAGGADWSEPVSPTIQ
jgi:hypothetical protein